MRVNRSNSLGIDEGRCCDSHFGVATATRASTITMLLAVPLILLLFALPAFAGRALLQELFYVFTMLALAQLCEFARRLRRPDFRRATGLRRRRSLRAVRPHLDGGPRAHVVDHAGRDRRWGYCRPGCADRLPPERRLLRHRHLGGRRGLSTGACAIQATRRRHRNLTAAGHRWFHCRFGLCSPPFPGPRPSGARHPSLLAGSRSGRRHAHTNLQAAAIAVRTRAIRHRRR